MVRVALRGVAAHKVRLLATGLAVLLSVAFMGGTRLLGDTIESSLGEVWTDASAGIDVACGGFGAMMDVHLVNAGPVTVTLEVRGGRVV